MEQLKGVVLTKKFLAFVVCMLLGYIVVGKFLAGTFLGFGIWGFWLFFLRDIVKYDGSNRKLTRAERLLAEEERARQEMERRRLEGGRIDKKENAKPRGLEDRFKS